MLLQHHRTRLVSKRFFTIALVIFLVYTIAPFLWLVSSSLQTEVELSDTKSLHIIPPKPTFANFVRLFSSQGGIGGSAFMLALQNSVIVAVGTTLLAVLFGVPAAYAFAKLDLPKKGPLLLGILALTMLPAISVIVPLFVVARELSILNTKLSLIAAYTTFSLPFVIWIMNGYFKTVPSELEEAARIDGASRFKTFLRISVPLAVPGLAATAIFIFLEVWDEFLYAVVFTSTYTSKTVPVALAEFQGRFYIDWGMILAGGVVSSVPPVLMALLLQRFLVTGLSAGALKG
jgi:multiple sugar transport system permease protein